MCVCVCVCVCAGITRVLFTQPDIDARMVVMTEMDTLNLNVRYETHTPTHGLYVPRKREKERES